MTDLKSKAIRHDKDTGAYLIAAEDIEQAATEMAKLKEEVRLVSGQADANDERARAAEAENARLRSALERLASNKAFTSSRVSTAEEIARMHYAQGMLNSLKEKP